jgi:hypothetical protein
MELSARVKGECITFMAGTHGRRRYLQILLEPTRADLLEEMAKEKGMRLTGLAREFIYDGIKRASSVPVYKEAEAKDAAIWRESVRNRIEGRTKKRKEIEESGGDQAK